MTEATQTVAVVIQKAEDNWEVVFEVDGRVDVRAGPFSDRDDALLVAKQFEQVIDTIANKSIRKRGVETG